MSAHERVGAAAADAPVPAAADVGDVQTAHRSVRTRLMLTIGGFGAIAGDRTD